MKNRILVFTKPWKEQTLAELADLVKKMGFDGVELPVREGYQVTPENIGKNLKEAKEVFLQRGLVIGSIAGSLEKETIEAMGQNGIPILRICISVDREKGYFESVRQMQRQVIALKDVLEKNNVKVGMQNHHGFNVGSALGLHHLLGEIPATIAGAVLDFAHCGLDGEPIEMAYDIVKDNLILINFKSAYKFRTNGPDEEEAFWQIHWVTGRNGLYPWKDAVALLKKHSYAGDICMPAEYNHIGVKGPIMGIETIERTVKDLHYLKSLLGEE
jgi:sugar phosphate isomerase/epimerase